MGYLCSITMDFVISADRLFAIVRPIYRQLKLTWRYSAILIVIAWGRGVFAFSASFVGLRGRPPICDLQDDRLRNCFVETAEVVNIALIVGTILNYMLTIPAAR